METEPPRKGTNGPLAALRGDDLKTEPTESYNDDERLPPHALSPYPVSISFLVAFGFLSVIFFLSGWF
jgi:hypothetical protein